MAFDITTTNTWASKDDQNNLARAADAEANIEKMISEGKTDGSYLEVTPVTTIRYWIDLAAAQEFAAFVSTNAATHNCTLVSTEYGTRS